MPRISATFSSFKLDSFLSRVPSLQVPSNSPSRLPHPLFNPQATSPSQLASRFSFFFLLLSLHRHIDGTQNRRLMPKFVLKEMECLYLEEIRTCINTLMGNLESLPVAKGTDSSRLGFQKLKRYNHK